jgi:hypothetical protein
MASEVFSGSSNFSYTNSTGQNVRIIINYARAVDVNNVTMSWGSGGAVSVIHNNVGAFGKNIAFYSGNSTTSPITLSAMTANNAVAANFSIVDTLAFPTEIMLANGHTFSLSNINAYNIISIKEDGS